MMEYPKYKKVLFCTDFSQNADYAFEFAYGIAKKDKGLLYILHVIPDNPYRAYAEGIVPSDILEKTYREHEEHLAKNCMEHYAEKMKNGVPFEIVTKSGRKDDEIIEFAKEEKADLIVMGTHGRGGIQHLLFGSVAEKVLRRSPFPVFVIPCKKKQRT